MTNKVMLVIITGCLVLSAASYSQENNCNEIASIAKMAGATSPAALSAERQQAGESYRNQVVFAARMFELQPRSKREADLLLARLPKTTAEQNAWATLGDSLCSSEPLHDMGVLAKLRDRLPHDLARAVLLAPGKMSNYLTYALVSVQDPHSDYAVQMRTVCQSRYVEFVKAVTRLPSEDREWFVHHVFNPKGCQALAIPEAD
jgi:hypothetical protein